MKTNVMLNEHEFYVLWFQLAISSQPTMSGRLILCSSWWESIGKLVPTSVVSSPQLSCLWLIYFCLFLWLWLIYFCWFLWVDHLKFDCSNWPSSRSLLCRVDWSCVQVGGSRLGSLFRLLLFPVLNSPTPHHLLIKKIPQPVAEFILLS
mgnify:CR=1 FL=1